jgi:hypothetical protein
MPAVQRYLPISPALRQSPKRLPTPVALAEAPKSSPSKSMLYTRPCLKLSTPTLLGAQGSVLEALEQRVYDQASTAIRASLGPAFESALAEGQALSWDHAIDTAVAALAL